MKSLSVTLLVMILLLSTSVALAKRAPPKDVAAIRAGSLEIRVPHAQMGCVEAFDAERGTLVWRRQIYIVKYQTDLERDVQDVFITSIEIRDDKLLVKNERASEYLLDLESLDVEVIKGSLVERAG